MNDFIDDDDHMPFGDSADDSGETLGSNDSDTEDEQMEDAEDTEVEQALALFGLSCLPTKQKLKKLYRSLVWVNHPDRSDAANATQVTQEITAAYRLLLELVQEDEDEDEDNNGAAAPRSSRSSSSSEDMDVGSDDDDLEDGNPLPSSQAARKRAAAAEQRRDDSKRSRQRAIGVQLANEIVPIVLTKALDFFLKRRRCGCCGTAGKYRSTCGNTGHPCALGLCGQNEEFQRPVVVAPTVVCDSVVF
jgi:DnaJ-class molecular chaperone